MTYWIFVGKRIDDYIDPNALAFKRGTFMYHTHTGTWYCCRASAGPAPKKNVWNTIPDYEVPKDLRAYALLLT